jgi:hypothetical protein
VEQAALVLAVEPCLADEARFAAVGVGAEGECGSAVDAFWAVSDRLRRHN